MNKILSLLVLCISFANLGSKKDQYIARQGQVTFFSYTSVENIEAKNNQVLSILDIDKQEIAISMLMRAFVFKKDLMYEHFNESYIESDLYPKANFEGKIIDFDASKKGVQTKIIRGNLTIHGISKKIEIKSTIENTNGNYTILGKFDASVTDFQIKIPPILSSNIAKTISIQFKFQYQPYDE
ncbi:MULTISPECIES: YceI family protein [unclassified Polaribacter]|uniref:YceI family protein n=1 Tax=unclassified Polaribacter TaxID=196858 RepID=UPI0011BD5AE3|nr:MULTISPECIES: YceI family protein [unclassified Polaribacter]TXD53074.1 YceI family protein [Polaribacter sp. IC063]TXD59023.1 YceI family protein [Polaribacter sp. IC066]